MGLHVLIHLARIERGQSTDPLGVDDLVDVASNGGEPLLCVFNVETGNLAWSFNPGGSDRICGEQ